MKHRTRWLWVAAFIQASLLAALAASGLNAAERVDPILVSEASGGGLLPEPADIQPSEEQRRLIQEGIERNISMLGAAGRFSALSLSPPVLGWPLRPNNGLSDFGYHGTFGFVDLDPAFPDHLLDYACGTRTYDLASGYNHGGIDYTSWPFPWNKMDNGEVAIVAAAPGTIVFTHDGEFDRSCGRNNNGWNIVVVRHADGSVAWYGHMRNGSVTTKGVGESVSLGEYLGLVGSSGDSTGPHLHFELHDASGRVIEPHAGPCNPGPSWWADQRPYFDSAINKLTSGFSPPVAFSTCSEPELPNEATDFAPDSVVYLTAYYRDQRNLAQDPVEAATHFALYGPTGKLALQWTHSSPADHYPVSYWYFGIYSKGGLETGTYRWEVVYQGVTYNHYFTVSGESGPSYARCIKTCNETRQSCDAGCQVQCRELSGGIAEQGNGCISGCKESCVDNEKECKDICQAN